MAWYNPNDKDYFMQRFEDWLASRPAAISNWWKNDVAQSARAGLEQLKADWYDLTHGDYESKQESRNEDKVLGAAATVADMLTGQRNKDLSDYQQKLNINAARLANDLDIEKMRFQQNYETAMANTSYQRGVADLEAAGLNPMLAYSQGGAAVPTTSISSSHVEGGRVDTTNYLRDILHFAVQTASVIAGLAGNFSRNAVLEANNSASNTARMAAATANATSRMASAATNAQSRIDVERFKRENQHASYRRGKY